MLQHKDIKNLNEIKDFFTQSEKVSDTILDFYRNFFDMHLTRQINSLKKRGYKGHDILLTLLLLPFHAVSSIRALFISGTEKLTDAEKDVYYRFKNRSDINWRNLHIKISKRFDKLTKQRGDSSINERPKCFIADDTTLEKSGKKIEHIGRVYDHVKQRMVLGFKMLLLGYWDGKSFIPLDQSFHNEKGKNKKRPFGLSGKELKQRYQKKREPNSAGSKRIKELTESKITNTVKMIKRAVRNGFSAQYVLTDKWFMSERFIKDIRKIKGGLLHILGMCKMDKRKYLYDGKEYSAKQLLQMTKHRRKRSKKINAWYIELIVSYKGIRLKLFFSRYSKRGKWQLLVTSNLNLTYNKAIEIYNIRWSIEVFFKEAKQYLNLGKSESNDFDAQITDATISMIQYIVLGFYKRFLAYETTGELFRESRKQLLELTIVNRIWVLFVELQLQLIELFEIEIDELYGKMLNDAKYEKILITLLKTIKQQTSDNTFNNAA
ncbi:MAG: IS4 family transposase [Methanosarcinaceae archaeon]